MTRLVLGENERVADWIISRLPQKFESRTECQCIGLERDGMLVAGVVFEDCDGVDIKAGIAIDGWMNKEFLRAIFLYPFIQLGCKRITCTIAAQNRKARTLVEKMGFKQEGTKRNALIGDDFIYYGMLREECTYV